jgi:hypothetical protein
MKNQLRKISWMWVILITALIISLLAVCGVVWLILVSRDFFGSSNLKTEADLTFVQALSIFDLPDTITLIRYNDTFLSDYDYESNGWQDWSYRLSFDTNFEGVQEMLKVYSLDDSSENVYKSASADLLDKVMWNAKRCIGTPTAFEIEVEYMHYAEIAMCSIADERYQIYLHGGTT